MTTLSFTLRVYRYMINYYDKIIMMMTVKLANEYTHLVHTLTNTTLTKITSQTSYTEQTTGTVKLVSYTIKRDDHIQR